MSADQRNRKKANNERVPVSEIRHFMCYMCGEMLTTNVDYQKHMTIHQAVALGYQFWHIKYKRKPKGGLSVDTSFDSSNEKDNTSAKSTPKALDTASPSTRRAIDREASEPRVGSRKRKTPPGAHEESFGPEKKKRRSPSVKVEKETRKKKAKKTKRQKKDVEGGSDLIPPPSEDQDQRKPSFLKIDSERRCGSCSYKCNAFDNYVCHYIEEHEAEISKIMLNLFRGNRMFIRRQSMPGDWCSSCDIRISTPEKYYEHLVSKHVMEVAAIQKQKADDLTSVDMDVHLKFTDESDVIFSCNLEVLNVDD